MPESHQEDKRQRPDPGPRCDPADVEMWEQLQRALTKLDQAEQREKELRRERDRALFDLKTEGERHEETQERAEQAEAQRDALAEVLREIRLHARAEADDYTCVQACDRIIERVDAALDALDQTNRENDTSKEAAQ